MINEIERELMYMLDYEDNYNIYSCANFFKSINMVSKDMEVVEIGEYKPFVIGFSPDFDYHNKREEDIKITNNLIKDLDSILRDKYNEEEFKTYLQKLIIDKGFENSEIIFKSNIDKSYFYKILTGEKIPSRDRIIQIAIALELNVIETNDLLGKLGYALYGGNKRDMIIIHCIENKINLIDIDYILDNFKEKTFCIAI